MKDNKYDLLDEQVNKIDDVIKVLTEKFGDNFEDELNYLAIVKANIEEAVKK
ncbi:hypothetical protein [Hallella colorans]|uniref:hypothetical protein n=1 Tax=Hallella colorans TaxID=1703337 RepID=UPI00248E1E02|nr:hypothetical protein [Hallella colorans]